MPASRVTKSGRRDRRFSNQAKGFRQQVVEQGAAAPIHQGLGEMPLTLWVIVAAVVLYLYLRRANLGIDTHPGEGKSVTVRPRPNVSVGPPVLPPIPPFYIPQTPEEAGIHVYPIPSPSSNGGGVLSP